MGNLCGHLEAQAQAEGRRQWPPASSEEARASALHVTTGGGTGLTCKDLDEATKAKLGIKSDTRDASRRGGPSSRGTAQAMSLKTRQSLLNYFYLFDKLPQAEGHCGLAVGSGTWFVTSRQSRCAHHLLVVPLPLETSMVPLVCRQLEAISPSLSNSHPNVCPGKLVLLTEEHMAVSLEVPSTDGQKAASLAKYVGLKRRVPKFKRGLSVTEEEARYFFVQLITAVEHFHRRRVAHLELNLDNCLLDCSVSPPVLRLGMRGFCNSWRVDARVTYSMMDWKPEAMGLWESIQSVNNSMRGGRVADLSVRGGRAGGDPSNRGVRGDTSSRGVRGDTSGRGVRGDTQNSGSSYMRSASSDTLSFSGLDDDVLGCTQEGAKAVDVHSCGVCLFAMLMGSYPQAVLHSEVANTPWLAAELIHGETEDGWASYPSMKKLWALLSEECQDLLLRMFNPDEKARITLAEARRHPWLQAGEPGQYKDALSAMRRAEEVSGAGSGGRALDFEKEARTRLQKAVWYACTRDYDVTDGALCLNIHTYPEKDRAPVGLSFIDESAESSENFSSSFTNAEKKTAPAEKKTAAAGRASPLGGGSSTTAEIGGGSSQKLELGYV